MNIAQAADRLFAFSEELRSESENGQYAATVVQALRNQDAFENFKQAPAYRDVLEHVTEQQGAVYLDILKRRDDGMLKRALETVLISDSVGNPVKFTYPGFAMPLSGTTLRYVKVASDLKRLFGEGVNSVAEIGCGYGGQCLVNDQLLNIEHATLFDLPFVNQLIQRYLGYTLMNGAFEVATINEKRPQPYDLVISNYAFSELPAPLQRGYIKKVLAKSARGYLTMNSGIGGMFDHGKLSLAEMKDLLPPFECLNEEPLTYPYNYVIVWGHDRAAVDGYFTRK